MHVVFLLYYHLCHNFFFNCQKSIRSKVTSFRLIYQNAGENPPERGIEYDRLIEVTEHSSNFGKTDRERERKRQRGRDREQ